MAPFFKTCFIFILIMYVTACQQPASNNKTDTSPPTQVTVAQAVVRGIQIKYNSVGNLRSPVEPQIRSLVQGYVLKVNAHEGQTVTQGQLLIRISKEKAQEALYQAESALLRSQANLQQKKDLYQSYAKLVKQKNVAQVQFEQTEMNYRSAEAEYHSAQYARNIARYNLFQTDIYSPIDGQVLVVNVSEGETVMPGDKLIKLVNHDVLHAYFPFSEEKMPQLQVGQIMSVKSVIDPNDVLKAKVMAISPTINTNNRGVNVILEFKNQSGWRAGASVVGELIVSENFKTLMIPEESVVLRPSGYIAFVVKNNKAQERLITTGITQAGWVEIKKGIQPNEWVVVKGADFLENGSPVQVSKP